mmetsp:Transcript_15228/g.35895  ORF Transcript_15228/g.35895 Transcript_15228/m.35895 type:complete len:246 (+) Transcript_15228:869-1606(+)
MNKVYVHSGGDHSRWHLAANLHWREIAEAVKYLQEPRGGWSTLRDPTGEIFEGQVVLVLGISSGKHLNGSAVGHELDHTLGMHPRKHRRIRDVHVGELGVHAEEISQRGAKVISCQMAIVVQVSKVEAQFHFLVRCAVHQQRGESDKVVDIDCPVLVLVEEAEKFVDHRAVSDANILQENGKLSLRNLFFMSAVQDSECMLDLFSSMWSSEVGVHTKLLNCIGRMAISWVQEAGELPDDDHGVAV